MTSPPMKTRLAILSLSLLWLILIGCQSAQHMQKSLPRVELTVAEHPAPLFVADIAIRGETQTTRTITIRPFGNSDAEPSSEK